MGHEYHHQSPLALARRALAAAPDALRPFPTVSAPDLHPAPALRLPDPEGLLQDRLPGHRPAPARPVRPAQVLGLRTSPTSPPCRRPASACCAGPAPAACCGRPCAASRAAARACGGPPSTPPAWTAATPAATSSAAAAGGTQAQTMRYTRFLKLELSVATDTHAMLGVAASRGPHPDVDRFAACWTRRWGSPARAGGGRRRLRLGAEPPLRADGGVKFVHAGEARPAQRQAAGRPVPPADAAAAGRRRTAATGSGGRWRRSTRWSSGGWRRRSRAAATTARAGRLAAGADPKPHAGKAQVRLFYRADRHLFTPRCVPSLRRCCAT